MTDQRRVAEVAGPEAKAAPAIDSATLMAGRRELIIRHGEASYRLRITASSKLILTK